VTDFRSRTDAFLSEFFPLFPTAATSIGEHAYDDRWPDMTAAGRQERVSFADGWLAEVRGLDGLSAEDAVDRDLLVQQLEAMRFSDLDLREEAWNPLEWVYLLGGGLFPLISREFAPLAERLTSIAGRLEGIDAVVDAAIEEIGPVGDRPVARFHTEKALEQLPGVIELADEAIAAAMRPRRTSRPSRRSSRACARRRNRLGLQWRASNVTCARRSCREARARGDWARGCLPRRCATRCAPMR